MIGTFWVRLPQIYQVFFPNGTVVEVVEVLQSSSEGIGQVLLKRFNNPVHHEGGKVGQTMDFPWLPEYWLGITKEEIMIYIVAGG
jgi:hypothetical protein